MICSLDLIGKAYLDCFIVYGKLRSAIATITLGFLFDLRLIKTELETVET